MKRDPLIYLGLVIGSLCLLGLVIWGIVWLRCPNGQCLTNRPQLSASPSPEPIANFSECAAAGYPVLESYPRLCRTPDGRSFTEEVSNGAEVADRIYVDYPQPNARVTSPLRVTGAARGNWYFEASFPITLLGGASNILVVQSAHAQGEWMTTDFVPFSVSLSFAPPTSTTGTLVLEKDNPSGLSEHAAELRIPVRFR